MSPALLPRRFGPSRARGSVLIIVMWICLGLVALTVYFAHSVDSELQAAANRVGQIEARQAVAGGIRYAAYILNNYAIDGVVPNSGILPEQTQDYYSSALRVGDAKGDPQFWFVGRDPNNEPTTTPVFSLVDEASKLNLNNVTATMLENLPFPNLDPNFASAVVSWSKKQSSSSSSASNLYSTLEPARLNKGAPFESTDELRLVYGATLDVILGEDTNRNGALDPNEDDGDQSPPHDNQDGQLQPGMLEYVTAFAKQPTTITPTSTTAGTTSSATTTAAARFNVATLTAATSATLRGIMTRKGISAGTARQYINRAIANLPISNVADFMWESQISAADFALIHTSLTSGGSSGLVNVNTASEEVLAAIPGFSPTMAANIVSYRLANPGVLTSFQWLRNVQGISRAIIRRAGAYITDQSYQFSADIAAVGRNGRGFYREKVVFDTSQGVPRIIYRQDLSAYGWPLGSQLRQTLRNGQLN